MQQPLISIIVPIYKAERYLHKTINSVIDQSYSNWELLLIDDGSPDNSGEICDEYAKKDSRIRVFHKENGGVSSARNLGLVKAKGEWIAFLDSDDSLHPNTYQDFVLALNQNPNVNHFIQGFNKGKTKVTFPDGKFNILETFRLTNETPGCCCGYIWHRYFKRTHIGDLRFDENMSFAEDGVFWFNYMRNISETVFLSSLGYNYYITNENSLTSKYIEESIIEYVLISFVNAFKIINTIQHNEQLKQYFDIFLAKKIIQFTYRGINTTNENKNKNYFNKLCSFARKNMPQVRYGLSKKDLILQNQLYSYRYNIFKLLYWFFQKVNGFEKKLGI